MMKPNKLADHVKFISTSWLSRYSYNTISKAVLMLQRGLTGERTLITETYMDNAAYTMAYLAYYWPVSYTQMQHSLEEAHDAGYNLVPLTANKLTILDFGSGPAPMCTALLDYVSHHYPAINHITLYLADISQNAMDIGKSILANSSYPFTLTIHTICTNSIAAITNLPVCFDCIIFGHCLNELIIKQNSPFNEINNLFIKALNMSGTALFIEPALLSTSRNLIALRNFLLEKKTISYTLPCPNVVQCSVIEAGPSHTCHDEFLWNMPPLVSRLAQSNGLTRDTIKMTWFLMFRQSQFGNSNKFIVVSEPLLNKAGRIRFIVCGSAGRIALSAAKADVHAQELGFFNLKRGDVIKIENPQIRESGYGIAKETKIMLEKQH